MASLLKTIISKLSYKSISLRSFASFPCYICNEKFSDYTQIQSHIDDFDCIVKGPLYPPSKHLPGKLSLPDLHPYAACLPEGVYMSYDPQETKDLVSMLTRFPYASFLIYVDSPQRATSLEVILKSCFKLCTSIHYLMSVSTRRAMVNDVKYGLVQILITTDLEDEPLNMGKVDFIVHYDFLFPNLNLFMKRTLVQFGVPTHGVFIYYPVSSNSPSSSVAVAPFENPLTVIGRIIQIENHLVGSFIGKYGHTLKYFQRVAGVTIRIYEPTGSPLRSIQIVGTHFAINKALNLITTVLSKAESASKSHDDYGGGSISDADLDLLMKKTLQMRCKVSTVKDVAPVKGVTPMSRPLLEVCMDRGPYLRKVDLKSYSNYMELTSAIERMFSCFTIGQCSSHGVQGRERLTESQLKDLLHGSEYVLTYEDKDSDWRLVGDVPWDLFIDSCRRLRIMKGSDAIGLGL